jgi:hypothetical protein
MKLLCTFCLLILSFSSYAQAPTIISNHVIRGNCSAVACGNGVCVASAGTTFTSPDARTWMSLNSDSVPSFGFLAFGNGIFVGVAGNAGIYTSTDGTSWTPQPADVGSIVTGLKFTHGTFYVVADDTTITRSDDGINWTHLTLGLLNPPALVFGGFDYNGSEYVIGVTIPATRFDPNGHAGALVSPTGESGSWTYINFDISPYVKKVTWLKDRFYVFADGGIATSTDGITWESTASSPSPLIDTLPDGSVVTAAGDDIFAAGDSVYLVTGSFMAISTDGTHFKRFNGPSLSAKGGLYVNGVTVIYGDGGLATATDGIHFKLNGTSFSALASNGSGFAAAGFGNTGGQIFSSPDFTTWTEDTSGLSAISTILYTGTKYVAAGSGNIYFSDDGTNWSNNTVPDGFSAMGYGNGQFVGGAFYQLMSSADALTWNVVDTNYSYYYKIRYLNNSFFALGMSYRDNTGRILQSVDGIHWQNITPAVGFTVTYYNDAMYDGTKYYFTGRRNFTDFFTISTTDPTNTASYGAVGTITNPAPGTSAVDYFPQFDDFAYHNGRFAGTVIDGLDGPAYLAYSSDGMSWTTTPLGGTGHGKMAVSNGDTYHIVTDDGGFYTVNFAGSVLPVTLFDFEAMAVTSGAGENSRLTWRTASESNSAWFLVQHSVDAVHWDSIGRVDAAGQSRITESYQFTHAAPPVGGNYYRLGMTDLDGQRQWSPVRKVDIGTPAGDLRIYPNPARATLQLQLPGPGTADVTVYNSAGLRMLQQVAGGYNITLDLGSLPAGIYHLMVYQGGKRYTREFIIAE